MWAECRDKAAISTLKHEHGYVTHRSLFPHGAFRRASCVKRARSRQECRHWAAGMSRIHAWMANMLHMYTLFKLECVVMSMAGLYTSPVPHTDQTTEGEQEKDIREDALWHSRKGRLRRVFVWVFFLFVCFASPISILAALAVNIMD